MQFNGRIRPYGAKPTLSTGGYFEPDNVDEMPKSTNDEIVKRHAEPRGVLIDKHALIAARKIARLKKTSVEEIAAVIAEESKASAI